MKILLVEDDELFAEKLSNELRNRNYVVEAVSEANIAWDYIRSIDYDLVVLDVDLPDSDGIYFCQKLRQANYQGAVLMLTANDEHALKVRGLDSGADDYVVKTCNLDELYARIRAIHRRPRGFSDSVLSWGDLQLDPRTCQVLYAQKEISLSPKEYGLLELFLRNPQRVFSSGVLLERLWSFEETPGEETVRTHIKRLRRKLKQAGVESIIENVYGMGYRLIATPEPEPDSASKETQAECLNPDSPEGLSASFLETSAARKAEARKAAISALDKFRDVLSQRLAMLDQFLMTIERSDRPQQTQARQAAHKLAGSLGMFGLTEGSRLSRDIDTLLQSPNKPDSPTLEKLLRQLHQAIDPILVSTALDYHSLAPLEATAIATAPSTELSSVLVISNDQTWVSNLTAASRVNVQTALPEEIAQQDTLQSLRADLVLIDLPAFSEDALGWRCLKQLTADHPALPMVVLIEPDTFQMRLDVTRCAQSCKCLPRTMPIQKIVDSAIAWYRTQSIPQLHLLVVDDDPAMLKAIEHHLADENIRVMTIDTPHQFWDTLCQSCPDLLLLDYEMPGINGIELCRIIRADQRWQHLPIMFLSANQDSEIIHQAYQAGADDYITKPLAKSELLIRIRNRVSLNRRLRE